MKSFDEKSLAHDLKLWADACLAGKNRDGNHNTKCPLAKRLRTESRLHK